MTTEGSPESRRPFARGILPWVVAAVALAIYLATLSHWITLGSLPLASKVAGWDWQPMLYQPVLFLLTFPLRWLPASQAPLALNLLTAVCAALTLALLARSVALLPQDRVTQDRLPTQDENGLLSTPNAWVPPVLAVVAAGLQLTFWENATAASGEMLDLLILAFGILCLLAYRLTKKQSWLDRAALSCGAGMANSWAMVGFLPLFIVALAWLKGLRFFRPRFLLRQALFGLAGSSLFLLLPLIQANSPESQMSFWQALRGTARSYKLTLEFIYGALQGHRDVALLLALVSLLPLLVLSIRWRSFSDDKSTTTSGWTKSMFYASHTFLLLACLWTAFDAPFSPRSVSPKLGFSLPFLSLYYLCALGVGYCSGFFLVMVRSRPKRRGSSGLTLRRFLRRNTAALVHVLLGLVLAGLVYKNLPAVRGANSPHLERYAELVKQSLPSEGAIVLSDDPIRLNLMQAALAHEDKASRYVPIDVQGLYQSTSYRAYLRRHHPQQSLGLPDALQSGGRGVSPAQTNPLLDAFRLIQWFTGLSQSNHIYYLHSSFGYLFEEFDPRPRGLICEMKPCPANRIFGPPLSPDELAENETFWKRALETTVNPILPLVAQGERPRPGSKERLLELVGLNGSAPSQTKAVAQWYSGALNSWGVTLQRNAKWQEAAPCFQLASQFNPDNLPAQVNRQCNSNLRAGSKMSVDYSKSGQDQFGKYRVWNQILWENGPFDDPSFCHRLGVNFAEARMLRQAGQQFERVMVLAPGDIQARLTLCSLWNLWQLPDQALETAAQIRADPNLQPLSSTNEVEVAFLEATAWFAKTNYAKAEAGLQSLLAAHPRDLALWNRALAAYIDQRRYPSALQLVDRQLQFAPDDVGTLVNKAFLCIKVEAFSNAITVLNRALSLTNSYPALFNRAVAYLRSGNLDAARADYNELRQVYTNAYQIYFGLGEIAFRRGETNAALENYRSYLSNPPPDPEELKLVQERLKALQPGSP